MAIRRADRARLARLAAPLVWAERHAVDERQSQRGRIVFFELVRDLLLHEGIDPESTCLMGRLRETEAALAAIPDTPELRQADDAYCAREDTGWIDQSWRKSRYRPLPVEEKTFDSEVERLVGRYRTDPQIDFTTASPMQLFAWCVSRQDDSAADAADCSLLFADADHGEPERGEHEIGDSGEENQ